jgi:flagellar hook-associated protein 3 FlgL
MAINSIGIGSTLLSQSVQTIKNQLTQLQGELTSGTKSQTYAGMGVNEGFAIAARAQLANYSAFSDTMTNVNTDIGIANTALQSMVDIGTTVLNSANSSTQTLNSAGQTIGQQTANSQLSSMLGILNMQAGNRYLFSGAAINTPSVNTIDNILNGTTTQAGLKQVISERAVADGTTGLGRLIVASPTASSVQVVEDAAGSPFGLKLAAVSSTLTGATVTGPAGSPPGVSISLGGSNPNNGDAVNFSFNLPDGTTETIKLTASSATPPPSGSFAIGATPAATASNLNAALTSAIGTLANTSLVAASAIEAGNDFFNSAATVTANAATNKAATPSPITGLTALSGAPGTDSLASNFVAGDSITVNGKAITFVASGATGNNQINVTDSVQTLLTKIDSITGTKTASTVSDGVIALHNDSGGPLTVSSTNLSAFAALGFGAVASQPPLGLAGSAVNNQATTPAPITGATLLAGAAGTDSLGTSFAAGNSIIVNGKTITFANGGGNTITSLGATLDLTGPPAAATVGNLLTAIDTITGTSIPSTVSGGAVAIRDNKGASLSIASASNPAAFAALGFTTPATVSLPPLQVAGTVASNQAAIPAPISGTTLLSGAAGTNSLGTGFAPGDTITVNGTPITFVAAGAAGNQLNVTDSVQTMLAKIDAITGTTAFSSVSGGAITLRSNQGASLSVTSSNSAAFAALGLGGTAPATVPPLRVGGTPLGSATSLVSGTPANTISWYLGESGPGSARASATARVDQSVTVQYGARANETAIRSQLQTLAVFAAVTTSATNPNAALQVQALSQRVAQNLAPQPGQQSIEDIQSDFATAQLTMKNAQARQTQSQGTLQGIIDQAESAAPDQVASEILALQTSLQASYQTTSMLSQLTLTKYLPIG